MTQPVLPDILAPNLRLVLCGTAPGHASAQAGAYYAHPQNKFWRVLHETGMLPERFAPADYACLPEYGLGLTDINKTQSGMDHELAPAAADAVGLRAKILHYQPHMVAFTSKKAASYFLGQPTGKLSYGLQKETVGLTQLWVLPSPSPAAQTSWDMHWWHALAEAVNATKSS